MPGETEDLPCGYCGNDHCRFCGHLHGVVKKPKSLPEKLTEPIDRNKEWHASLPASERRTIETSQQALAIIKTKGQNWNFWAEQAIKFMLPDLKKIQGSINGKKLEYLEEKIQELFLELDQAVPDSFEGRDIKQKK